jgi:hypothetical protein
MKSETIPPIWSVAEHDFARIFYVVVRQADAIA